MSKLSEQINQDLKRAMLAKEAEKLSTLRLLISAMRNKEISLRPAFAPSFAEAMADKKASAGRQDGKAELTDEQIIEVASSEIKKRRDSVLAYEQGQRQDLADKETREIKLLQKYLPAQLTDEELEKIIKEIIASGASDLPAGQAGFGKVMGQAIAKVKGKADGGQVGELVKKLLAK